MRRQHERTFMHLRRKQQRQHRHRSRITTVDPRSHLPIMDPPRPTTPPRQRSYYFRSFLNNIDSDATTSSTTSPISRREPRLPPRSPRTPPSFRRALDLSTSQVSPVRQSAGTRAAARARELDHLTRLGTFPSLETESEVGLASQDPGEKSDFQHWTTNVSSTGSVIRSIDWG